MRSFFLSALFLVSVAMFSHAQICKSNQFDMLDWMVPQEPTLNGHYNVLYPASGTFYWVKSNNGFPWDVDTFDARYIYQSVTEQDWNNPSSFKIFEAPLPWMPRCIDKPAVPGKIASISLPPQETKFDIHLSCTDFTTHNLGYVVNEIWGPYSQVIGRLPATPTLTLSYRYSCDSDFNNCRNKETFAMQKGAGLVQWTLYSLQNGKYVQLNRSTHDTPAVVATVKPVHPCW
jgi:hypothetical protein